MAIGARLRRLLPGGRERDPAAPPGGEVAASSIAGRLQQYIGELPADPRQPSRYADSWRDDSTSLRVYRTTLRDERCQAALDQRLDAAISRPWAVEAGGEEDRDRKAAEDLEAQLQAIDFDAICRQLLHGVWYGYAIAEAIWQREESRIALGNLIVRAPDRFRWSPEGLPLLRTERDPHGEELPHGKFVVLARPGEHGDLPHGPGLARWCFWPVWLKRHGLKFWSVSLEKFGAPSVVGKYPPNASAGQKAELLDLVHAYATSAGVTLPEGQEIEIVESARRAGGDFEQFIGYLDRLLTTTILGQSSTTDQGPWRGTAEVQKDVRDETVASDCRLLDNALNCSIARWLTVWNFQGAAFPRIRRDTSPPEDLDARAKREETIARTTGLRPTLAHIEEVYGGEWEAAPKPPAPSGAQEHDEAPGAPGDEGDDDTDEEPQPGDDQATLAAALYALARGRAGDTIDRAVARMVAEDWEPMMAPVIEPILTAAGEALERGDKLEDFRARLPDLLAAMDDEPLVETLHRMGFSAALSGRAGLVDE
ncbi:MAG: DUF935 family protein [Rhodospirillaceae bacterium]|nr:DUF935 family protein [Rhodospirillaceae bacterium]